MALPIHRMPLHADEAQGRAGATNATPGAAIGNLPPAEAAKVLDDGQVWIDRLDHRHLLSHTYSPVVFEKAVEAIQTRYPAGMAQLHDFMQQEAMK